MVAVLPREGELLTQRARAELAAAVRVVDYVVIADRGDLELLVDSLKPLETRHWESCDTRRAQQLIDHVHRRQRR
jgi:hypothetical protein